MSLSYFVSLICNRAWY